MTAGRLRLLLWTLVAALTLFGLVMVSSVTGTMGSADGYNPHFILRQAVAVLVGLGGALCMSWFAV
ncbi:MAG: hypothetical protein ACOCXJ_01125, partial [Planctomycetota bacterium]